MRIGEVLRLGLRSRFNTVVIPTLALTIAILGFQQLLNDNISGSVVAGLVIGPLALYLINRSGGGLNEVAINGLFSSILGSFLSLLLYYVILGISLEKQGIISAVSYLLMMIKSGVFIAVYVINLLLVLTSMLAIMTLLALLFIKD